MTVMYNVELDASGQPIKGKKVYLELLAGGGAGYGDGFSVESVGEAITDTNGRWDADLLSTDNEVLYPAGARYSATLRFRGGVITHIFQAPNSSVDQKVTDWLTDVPVALPSAALSLHVGQVLGAHKASAISMDLVDGLVATNVQSALVELVLNKQSISDSLVYSLVFGG